VREKEMTLFSLKESSLLYDLTSTYFEGLCLSNAKAKRGYSRDYRSDCKQVVVGLVLDGDGFPKAHEIFAGNRSDPTTVAEMLGVLEKRLGEKKDATVIVDRGMANDENPSTICKAGYHWLVAARQPCVYPPQTAKSLQSAAIRDQRKSTAKFYRVLRVPERILSPISR
jgi:transposase